MSKRIEDILASLTIIRTLDNIIITVMTEFKNQTVQWSITQSTKDAITVLSEQLRIINSEHISSIGDVERLIDRTEREINIQIFVYGQYAKH